MVIKKTLKLKKKYTTFDNRIQKKTHKLKVKKVKKVKTENPENIENLEI